MALNYIHSYGLNTETVTRRCYITFFLKISQNSEENTCARVFYNGHAGLQPAVLKRDSGASIIPWILRNFQERLICGTFAI